jgi:signal transduction histidine kinase
MPFNPVVLQDVAAPKIVLSVGADAAVRSARNEILRGGGFEVIESVTGTDALKRAAEKRHALVVLAIEPPGMDGFAVCQRLKADPSTASIPVLHISSRCEPYRYYAESLESGADAYLEEPVEPAVLIAVVTALIRTCITTHKRIEDALRASEQQMRALAGSLLTAQEDERRRLARELHDDITQRMAFLSMALGRLLGDIPDSVEKLRDRIRALQTRALEVSTEVRRISHGLHPSAIEDFGLSIALEEFCEECEKAHGVKVRFEGFIEDAQLDAPGATCLYRIAQESLRNAVIHGGATEILVALSTGDRAIQLQVRDNGMGLSTDAIPAKTGLGVVSMRERIRLVNGTITISSQPGQGTEITVSVPLAGGSVETGANSAG